MTVNPFEGFHVSLHINTFCLVFVFKFSLNPDKLHTAAAETYGLKSLDNSLETTATLHHSVVRGVIALLSDPSSPDEIGHKCLVNIWFFYEIIVKSLAQQFCETNRIKVIGFIQI